MYEPCACEALILSIKEREGVVGEGRVNGFRGQSVHEFRKFLMERPGGVVELLHHLLVGAFGIGGKVEKVGDKLVHLSQLSGAEFYDAAVDLGAISAVIVRVKK